MITYEKLAQIEEEFRHYDNVERVYNSACAFCVVPNLCLALREAWEELKRFMHSQAKIGQQYT